MTSRKKASSKTRAKRPRVTRNTPHERDGGSDAAILSKPARLALDQFKLENVISHLLRRAHFAAEDVFAREFAAEDITPRQKAALIAVYQQPGVNQNALAALLFMDRNTIAEMASRLAARGLIKRAPASDDRRAYQLFLTPTGASLLERVILRDAEVERQIIAKVPAKDRAIFTRCLRLLAPSRES